MSLSKENCAVIYVWFSEADGGENVGHAALEIPHREVYISLWPAKYSNKKYSFFSFFEHRNQVAFHSHQDDLYSEEREADFICCLYTLDIDAIENKFNELLSTIGNWSILGNTKINRPNRHMSHSCSSLIFDLLLEGGVTNLIPSPALTTRLMPSPHNIFTMTRSAKYKELSKHPKTRKFDTKNSFIFNPHNEIDTLAITQGIKYCLGLS